MSSNIKLFLLSLMLCAAYVSNGSAQTSAPDKNLEGIDIIGDKIEYDRSSKIMTGVGNVVIRFEGVEIRSDHIVFNNETNIATCQGRVEIRKPGGVVYSGDAAVYNFNTQLLEAKDGDMFDFPWYGKGASVEKVRVDPDKYVIKDGFISTCGLDNPEYRIWASRFHVHPGNKIIAYNVVLMLGKLPVLYLPVYVHWLEDRPPIETSYGRSSTWGVHLLSRYNYKINDRHKGAIRFDYRELMGFAYGLDQRYTTPTMDGYYSFYWVEERDKSGIEKSHQTERDRWRHKWVHRQLFEEQDIEFQAQIFKIKDIGFQADYFRKEFSLDTTPDSYVYLNKHDDDFSARLLLHRKMNKIYTVNQRLPEFDYDIVRRPLFDTDFFINYRFNAVRLRRDAGRDLADVSNETDRIYSEFELSHPVKITPWLNAYPYIKIDDTYYSRDLREEERFRHTTNLGIELNSKFWHVYDYHNQFLDINQIRHVMEPSIELFYRDVPDVEQREVFQYDALDEREGTTRVRFRLDTRLQTKRGYVGSQWVRGRVNKEDFYDPEDVIKLINADLLREDPDDDDFYRWQYHNMAREKFLEIIDDLELYAPEEVIEVWEHTHDSYETNKEYVGLANTNASLLDYFIYVDWIPEESGHEWSDIFAELDVTPVNWLTLSFDMRYDTRRMDFRSVRPSLTFSYFDNWRISGGWSYTHDHGSSLSTSVEYRPSMKWKFIYAHEYNFENADIRNPHKSLAIQYNSGCTVTQLELVQRKDEIQTENIVWYTFFLKAFPEEKIETKAFRYTETVDNTLL